MKIEEIERDEDREKRRSIQMKTEKMTQIDTETEIDIDLHPPATTGPLPAPVSCRVDTAIPTTKEQTFGIALDHQIYRFEMKMYHVSEHAFPNVIRVSTFSANTALVLDGAQISAEEYEIMKDLMIPLGRVPEFSTQSGG
ncbi:hypothetical protein TEA_011743 [Camellia sinensis var. sinensis]|uniref:Uncharacterized protein n=1 Tax=Camellia sinensis var. sinensis TaxID=542762 RepID=A0A4S4DIA6_CAMSN|nr:hypothetical protein TEA_011743 [Camellia sinensis var. sinensis]